MPCSGRWRCRCTHTADGRAAGPAVSLLRFAFHRRGAWRAFLCEDSNAKALTPLFNFQVQQHRILRPAAAAALGRARALGLPGPLPPLDSPCTRTPPRFSSWLSLPVCLPPPAVDWAASPSAQHSRAPERSVVHCTHWITSQLCFDRFVPVPCPSRSSVGENNTWVLLLCSVTPDAQAAAWRQRQH